MSDLNIFSDVLGGIEEEHKTDQIGLFENIPIIQEGGKGKKGKERKKQTEPFTGRRSRRQYIDEEHRELSEQAEKASLKKSIQEERLRSIKLESEKMEVMAKAKQTINVKFGEFLFFSYMEKANVGILDMLKRVQPRIKDLILEQNADAIFEIYAKEAKAVFKDVKVRQAKEIDAWRAG